MDLLLTTHPECQSTLWMAAMGGVAAGITIAIFLSLLLLLLLHQHHRRRGSRGSFVATLTAGNLGSLLSSTTTSPALAYAEDKRRRLPQTIVLIRHGESEANANKALWKKIPDNLLGLTEKGRTQAKAAGKRVELLFSSDITTTNDDSCSYSRIHLVVSPFERTLQTASCLRTAIEHRIVRTDIESRIREQEMGNMQGDEFQTYRKEQKRVGRFWYRFREGESGADVLDRVKSWWYESVLNVNERVGYDMVDSIVVVTHGLTMRFILMQLFGWSPTTFHSVWNSDNCGMYVLQKDLSKPGPSPYVLDKSNGDIPRSSIDVVIKLKSTGKELALKLEDYLSIPPPRTTRIDIVKAMLASQYPSRLIHGPQDIASVLLMPFIVEDEEIIILGRSGVAESSNSDFQSSQGRRGSFGRRLEHCQFSCISTNSSEISSESDDRLCNCK